MCISSLPACMQLHHVHFWYHQSTEESFLILALKLEMIVSHQIGTRNPAWVLYKDKCSYLLSHQSKPIGYILNWSSIFYFHLTLTVTL